VDEEATKQRPAGRGGNKLASSRNLITKVTRTQALEERGLIRSQMRLGAGLIAFGALSIPLFQVGGVLQGQAATAAFAVATAVIGAGAAMLPTGAAAGASARILRSLPDQDAAADKQHGHPQRPSRQRPGPDRGCGGHGPGGPATVVWPVRWLVPGGDAGPRRTQLTNASLNARNE
jgi:hypothetical protein